MPEFLGASEESESKRSSKTPLIMHLPTFSLAIFTVATLISAGPIEPLPGTTPEKADGFYASRFEDDGSATLMEFIPLTDTMNNTTSSTILDTRTIEARSSAVTCENAILNRNDLISAWNCLIWTMTPSKTMEKNYVYHVSLTPQVFSPLIEVTSTFATPL
ncbi:hypothetical protein M7I_2152 [Glarea lozoyensis 74030]|uniref:Uncharacterized protein n=1 Tax=Glarea lozoyensis (strain ATCC 74030 / MF5533) TaxID=1104152 RepID=H0EI07_GLAL7|nr:hypothetical protein M7I_2152 [Glarea lozoyensis 74030]